jgi:hypothetical protein
MTHGNVVTVQPACNSAGDFKSGGSVSRVWCWSPLTRSIADATTSVRCCEVVRSCSTHAARTACTPAAQRKAGTGSKLPRSSLVETLFFFIRLNLIMKCISTGLLIYSIYISSCTVANFNNDIHLQTHGWSSTATGDLHVRPEPQRWCACTSLSPCTGCAPPAAARGVAGVGDSNVIEMTSRRETM